MKTRLLTVFHLCRMRVPKFILSDKVCTGKGDTALFMSIEKFKTVLSLETGRHIYTGLLQCYWFEGKRLKRALFHEDELQQVQRF